MVKNIKEILGVDEGKYVTFAFIDTILPDMDTLYHRHLWCGKERTVCIDAENKIYMVAIRVKKSRWYDVYDTINCSVQMLKHCFNIDLSEYHKKYIDIDTYVDLFE